MLKLNELMVNYAYKKYQTNYDSSKTKLYLLEFKW